MTRSTNVRQRTARLRLCGLLCVLLLGGAAPVGAEIFCDSAGKDPRIPMPASTALPYGAVGYLDNGCTGTLVSERHVLTAAHCLSQSWSDGAWQRTLTFSPHYSTQTTPTFVQVDRAIVGTRADAGAHLDWGIAHLAKPVKGFPRMTIGDPPAAPFRVTNAGYGRDRNRTSPQPTPAGAPCANEFCTKGGNVWWDDALVHVGCRVHATTGNTATTDCAVVGGNSGSPLFRSVPAGSGRGLGYEVVGVISGGPKSRDYQGARQRPACVRRTTSGALNAGAASPGFRWAPLFATGAAVVPDTGGVKRSVVAVTDSDASRLVLRERSGSKLADVFGDYTFSSFLSKPTALTALNRPGGGAALAAIASKGRLFARLSSPGEGWDHWREVSRPRGVKTLVDVDGLEGGAGELYVVAADGRAFRRRLEGTSWGPWLSLPGTGYRRVSAVRRSSGQRLVLLLRGNGDVLLSRGKASWTGAFTKPTTFGVGLHDKLADVDAVTGADGVVNVFAVGKTGGLWQRTTAGTSLEWLDWGRWRAQLYVLSPDKKTATPAALTYDFWRETTGPPLDGVTTLTATRWREPGTPNTVVLATDQSGNLYTTGYRCKTSAKPASCYWSGWRAFNG